MTLLACGRTSLPSPGDRPFGSTALFELGQVDATSNDNLAFGIENPSGVATCAGRLFVADEGNHRVLVWNTLPASGPADLAIGQLSTTTRQPNIAGVDARGLASPGHIACDATHLVVADAGNHRVLVWSPLPTASFAPASLVIGQPSFTVNAAPASVSATSIGSPSGVGFDGTRLVVSDRDANRALVYATLPTTNGAAASFVLGQQSFTTSDLFVPSAGSLSHPEGVALDGDRLAIADGGNHRVLVWPTMPIAMGQAAGVAVGQPTLGDNGSGSVSAATLRAPGAVTFSGNRLLVCDTAVNRVLVWNDVPASSGAPANVVLGQQGFTGDDRTPTFDRLLLVPRGIAVAGTQLVVADSRAHRIAIWDANPSTGAPLASVLGQASTTAIARTSPSAGVTSATLGSPVDVDVRDDALVVTDYFRNRVLLWAPVPRRNGAAASRVIGQANMSEYTVIDLTPTARSLSSVWRARFVGDALYVLDADHHRIGIFDSIPQTNAASFDRFLGQADGSLVPTSATSFDSPLGMTTDGARLAVSDSYANRVLVWLTLPVGNNAPADLVLGQASFDGHLPNAPGTDRGMSLPFDVTFVEDGLAVVDVNNARVLIWATMPSRNGAPPDVVLGQPDRVSTSVRAPSAAVFDEPRGVTYADGRLYVADRSRILVWEGLPTSDGQAADAVIGQASVDETGVVGALGADVLQRPHGMRVVGDELWIADTDNNRVLVRKIDGR